MTERATKSPPEGPLSRRAMLDLLPRETTVGNYFIANYPPFSTWSSAQVLELEAALDEPPAEERLCLYVHIPFCARRCSYCYYRVHTHVRSGDVDAYVASVLAEAGLYRERAALQGRRLSSAYFGGGSPSFLTEPQTRRLFEGLRSSLDWDAACECSFECEPAMATPKLVGTVHGSLGHPRWAPSPGLPHGDRRVLAGRSEGDAAP